MKSFIEKPVIILGCPRSGTTLLFTILGHSKQLYSLYNESRFIFKGFYKKRIKEGIEYHNDKLNFEDLDEETKSYFLHEFYRYSLNNRLVGLALHKILRKHFLLNPFVSLITRFNSLYKDTFIESYRIVEKTPRNCFKVSFMNKLFPDAKFIYIKRDGRSNISSLLEGWRKRKGGKKRFPGLSKPLNIKDYSGSGWHFVLPPKWEEYSDKTLAEVCAFQWVSSNQAILDGLKEIEANRKYEISYEELSENTSGVVEQICNFIDIPYSQEIKKIAEKPPVVNTFSRPNKDKWKRHEAELEKIYFMIQPMMNVLGYSLGEKKQAVTYKP
ncbi:MAG: sulfotransferase [Candidatus Melainabacteria bacterium]|nr:sulfotransferase [Candidatus Melainabacteria bacterium]